MPDDLGHCESTVLKAIEAMKHDRNTQYIIITEGGESVYTETTITKDDLNSADNGYLDVLKVQVDHFVQTPVVTRWWDGEWMPLSSWRNCGYMKDSTIDDDDEANEDE